MFLCVQLFGQDIRIYHGEKAESVFLKKNDKLENSSKESIRITRSVNGIITINILNPNPFFYNYEIKTEDVEIKDDYSDQFADLVKLISALPDLVAPTTINPFAARYVAPRGGAAATKFDEYQSYILLLNADIKSAKTAIESSDRPETVDEALKRVSNPSGFGFRSAIATIQGLPASTTRFNSKTLEKDLNDILDASIADGTFDSSFNIAGNAALLALYKAAFKGLNNQLLGTVNEILKVTQKDRIIRFQIPVKENKQTNIKLVITKINDKDSTVRELLSEEVATVLPNYVRKTFEVVPVVNLVFQSDRQKFYVENNLVKSAVDDEAKFNIGAMALMNFASFGEFKEFGVGFGIGYSLQTDGSTNSFFAMPSLSYKSIVRIGFGYGYSSAPVGLNNGAAVGSPLPANISNIEDVVDYKRKSAAVLSIAISGLKF